MRWVCTCAAGLNWTDSLVCPRGAQYRMQKMKEPAIAQMRAAIGDSTLIDMALLPHSERVLRCLPTRSLREGVTREGALPVVYAPLRRVDVDAFATLPDDMLENFLSAMLEQRALVLHNLSVAQQRVIKVVGNAAARPRRISAPPCCGAVLPRHAEPLRGWPTPFCVPSPHHSLH